MVNWLVFPTVNDIADVEGDGKMLTDERLVALIDTLYPRRSETYDRMRGFVITGFQATSTGSTTANVSAGSAILAGRYVESTSVIPVTSFNEGDYCYLYLGIMISTGAVASVGVAASTAVRPADTATIQYYSLLLAKRIVYVGTVENYRPTLRNTITVPTG